MSPAEIAAVLALHKLWLNNGPGKRADLRKADLSEANLRWADLECADLEGADLSGADLTGANLLHSTLQRKDIMTAGAIMDCCTMPDGRGWADYERNRVF